MNRKSAINSNNIIKITQIKLNEQIAASEAKDKLITSLLNKIDELERDNSDLLDNRDLFQIGKF